MTVRRKADQNGRITLFEDVAGQLVVLERINDDEIRVRKTKPRRPTLKDLLAGITSEKVHAEISFGPPFGRAAL